MTDEEKELWQMCQYRTRAEGFHYCFDGYSSWQDIKDKEFHKLRLNYLKSVKLLQQYIDNKVDEANEY